MSSSVRRCSGLLFLLILALSLASPVAAQEPQSAPLAKQLAALLDQAKLDSIAAKDPSTADTYVAALYFPGQLMVVSAKYSVPVILNDKIAKKDYRDIYNDLNGAPVAGTHLLVMDLGADGLKAKRDNALDTFEVGDKTWLFDGDWKAQKVTEDEYMKAFADADARYAKMLQALIAQLKKGTTD
ncbi:MAG: hypothetical protein ACM3NQ_03445 [Bacteroidales bacterium]